MGIIIKRAVRVKVVVTEEFKARRSAEVRASMARLDEVAKRLEFELESLSRRSDKGEDEKASIAERLRRAGRRNQQARAALARELETLQAVELGTEYDRGVLEGLVEVDVGDDFSRLAACEIVVRDDRIIDIREGEVGCSANGRQEPEPNTSSDPA
ncbi:MAG: YlqD family protein [Armatimonadota bacterium]